MKFPLLLLAGRVDTKQVYNELGSLNMLAIDEVVVSHLAEIERAMERPCHFAVVDCREMLFAREEIAQICLEANPAKLFFVVDEISVEESVRLMRLGVCGIALSTNLSLLSEWLHTELDTLHEGDSGVENNTTEIALHDSEARYRFLAENATDMISHHTAEGVYKDVTPSAYTVTGYKPEELIGTRAYAYFHKDDSGRILRSHQSILDGPVVDTIDYRFQHKDGHYIWLETTSHMIRNGVDGDVVEIVAVSRNVSERKAAEARLAEANQRLKLATQVASVGVWEWHFENEEMVWDQHMFNMYGVPFEGTYEIPLERWEAAVFSEDLPTVRQAVRRILRGDGLAYNVEFRIILDDGVTRYIQANAMVLRDDDGRAERLVGINVDVTDSREIETKLLSALEKEKELGDLKSRFISMASHEFRTPLATILATTESLSVYRKRMSEAQIDSRLAKIRSQIDHMKEIMEDVLSLARIQADRLAFKPEMGDLESLCREITEEFEIDTDYHGRIAYTACQRPMMGLFDPRLMRHVISNLVSNGLKYSAHQDIVQVDLRIGEESVEIVITDHGIGISRNDLEHIVEPFHRGDNVGVISGTGLGLSIATRAIEAHGGNLSFTSTRDVGSVAIASIPLRAFEVS